MEQLLVDKYTPKEFNDIVGQDAIVDKIYNCLENLPHLLFVGHPGIGKTTLVKVIIKHLNADVLWLNGSDSNGVNTFRSKEDGGTGRIDNFAKHSSLLNGGTKIIVIDECDGISLEGQKLLRGKIEKYQNITRMILTCNDDSKIIPALKSRFKTFRFKPLKTDDILKRINYICGKEKKFIDPKNLQILAEKSQGDIRYAINSLQSGDYNDEKPKDDLDTILAFATD